MKVHCLQHVPFEGAALIETWAAAKGYTLSVTSFFDSGYVLPNLANVDMIVVLGGPMSVNDGDQFEWLADEENFIREAIAADKYVLGICLGAQHIAKVLGANTNPVVAAMEEKEIGWFPIAFSDDFLGKKIAAGLNSGLVVLHWHGEFFQTPRGAINIASSAACSNQGFLYGEKVLGLQFHIEMNQGAVEKIVNACGEELVDSQYVQSAEEITAGSGKYFTEYSLFQLLDNWTRDT